MLNEQSRAPQVANRKDLKEQREEMQAATSARRRKIHKRMAALRFRREIEAIMEE